jgi:NAD(P)-dependent dehydrogenase (short-subunit alcohol dehydrogenase family)
MSFEGKVIAVTGAASGIGLQTAKLLAARGATLSLADVQQKPLEDLTAELKAAYPNIKVLVSIVNVRDNASVVSWIDSTVKTFGKLDGAANIAGIFKPVKAGQTIAIEDDDSWDLTIGVNLTGVMQCMRAQVPHIKSGGAIVNAASILSLKGSPGSAAYVASKHGVLGLTRSVAKEVGPKGVRVNCVAP